MWKGEDEAMLLQLGDVFGDRRQGVFVPTRKRQRTSARVEE